MEFSCCLHQLSHTYLEPVFCTDSSAQFPFLSKKRGYKGKENNRSPEHLPGKHNYLHLIAS